MGVGQEAVYWKAALLVVLVGVVAPPAAAAVALPVVAVLPAPLSLWRCETRSQT